MYQQGELDPLIKERKLRRLNSGGETETIHTKAADDLKELSDETTRLRAEVERLRAGGCARDQTTTQFCAEAARLAAENERLREALEKAINACDQGRMVEQGVGGMTIEAQMRRSVYNGVPVWPIEEARDVFYESRAALSGSPPAEQEKPNE